MILIVILTVMGKVCIIIAILKRKHLTFKLVIESNIPTKYT